MRHRRQFCCNKWDRFTQRKQLCRRIVLLGRLRGIGWVGQQGVGRDCCFSGSMATATPADEGDIRIEEDDILDNGSDLLTSTDHMSEDPDMEALTNRMKEIEEEAQLIRQMQSDVEKQMNMSTGSNTSQSVASIEDKIEADSRSIYVGNVDYCSTAEELEAHFHGCGSVNRVTILTDKFTGHPKGFAYIEFADKEAVQTALALDESLFRGRQIKVCAKRTNRPGVSTTNRPPRGRGRGGTRVIVKYIYAGYRARRPPRRRGVFAPY
uniref:RRM domain-containing protein n=1 Tax=Setaria digitata TaxID=48799 RepID=A0A915Q1C5_9BILA